MLRNTRQLSAEFSRLKSRCCHWNYFLHLVGKLYNLITFSLVSWKELTLASHSRWIKESGNTFGWVTCIGNHCISFQDWLRSLILLTAYVSLRTFPWPMLRLTWSAVQGKQWTSFPRHPRSWRQKTGSSQSVNRSVIQSLIVKGLQCLSIWPSRNLTLCLLQLASVRSGWQLPDAAILCLAWLCLELWCAHCG